MIFLPCFFGYRIELDENISTKQINQTEYITNDNHV